MKIRFLKPSTFAGLMVLSVLLWTGSCRRAGTGPTDALRIIDLMRPEHVRSSPMKDLTHKFMRVEENFSDRWRFVPGLSSNTQKVWGASTQHPVLGDPDSPELAGIRLLQGEREIPYLGSDTQGGMLWRLVQTAEVFDLRPLPGFDRDARGVLLKQGQSAVFEKLLPDREVVLQLYIVNANWESYRPKIEVLLDGETVEELVVSRQRWFRIHFKPSLGVHEIKVQWSGEGSPDAFILLGRAVVDCPSEIVLLSNDQAQPAQPPEENVVFHYRRGDTLAAGEDQAELPRMTWLYNYSGSHLLDQAGGGGSDPYRIKQKVVLDEYSLNALIAPARSEYVIPLRIPARAVLDFGLGFLSLAGDEASARPLRFLIKIEISGRETVLFDRESRRDAPNDGFTMERVDLSPYADEKANLSFETQLAPQEEGADEGIPFWINPVVYPLPEQPPTNIVLVSLDTVRPDFLGCYGNAEATSPALDAVAAESAVFLNAYSTTSWTLPAHVSLLTALDGLRHEVYYPQEKFDPATPTLAELLRARGYTTAAFTGGGYLSSVYGFSKGFDSYQEIKLHGNRAIRFDEAERLADLACDWIGNNRDKPFFLFLHTYQPHDPYANLSPLGKMFIDESAEWDQVRMESLFQGRGRFGTSLSEEQKDNIVGLYKGEIRYTDEVFVRPVLEALKKSNLYDNTLIILTSDHGEEFYDHESWLHDHSLYEEGIRIPLIIRFPGGRFGGQRIEAPARITDIMPTALQFSGLNPERLDLDGKSLFPLLQGREKQPRPVLADLALRQYQDPPTTISFIRDNLKVIVHKQVTSPYIDRMSRELSDYRVELYDLSEDPGERQNLANEARFRASVVQFIREAHGLFQEAEASRTQKNQVEMDRSLEERLKALGYIK